MVNILMIDIFSINCISFYKIVIVMNNNVNFTLINIYNKKFRILTRLRVRIASAILLIQSLNQYF